MENTNNNPIISLKNLTKKYGSLVAVDRLTLSVHQGEIFGLLGPNGAGKTTTILMMLGLTEPSSGEVFVCGHNATRDPILVKKRVGYLPDSVGFYDQMTAFDNLAFIARLNGYSDREAQQVTKETLMLVGLEQHMFKKAGTFSRGMKQRLGLADVLIKKPDIIILDEPTLGIDPSGVKDFLGLIKQLSQQQGLTVLLSSHHLHHVQQVCDRVGIFVGGRLIVEGDIQTLSNNLLSQEGHTTQITLANENNNLNELRDELLKQPSVEKVQIDHLRIDIQASQDTTADLVRFIVHKGYGIVGVKKKNYGLDDIYEKYFENNNHETRQQKKANVSVEKTFFKKWKRKIGS